MFNCFFDEFNSFLRFSLIFMNKQMNFFMYLTQKEMHVSKLSFDTNFSSLR